MSNKADTSYSLSRKEFHGVVPANTQTFVYQSPQGHFPVTRLAQTDILKAIQDNPVDDGHLRGPFDRSLAEVLTPIKESVGIMLNNNKQLGSCTLISANLAIIPCHCIEGIADVRELKVDFGFCLGGIIKEYSVKSILEYDQDLDFAIILLDGNPGIQHGYPDLCFSQTVYAVPALLHHPLGKPLQVSIHTFDQTLYQSHYLSTFHDSHYGSSGGAYISPSRTLVAIHLGAERELNNYNLIRLALPTTKIMQKNQKGILASLAKQSLNQKKAYGEEIGEPIYYISYRERPFIDLEKFFHKNLLEDCSYTLRAPSTAQPGVVIEHYQKKHCPNWPGIWKGKTGSSFSLHLDDMILLAEKLIDSEPMFGLFNPPNPKPPKLYWDIDKKNLGNELFKKLRGQDTIGYYAAFDSASMSWQIHIFPDDR